MNDSSVVTPQTCGSVETHGRLDETTIAEARRRFVADQPKPPARCMQNDRLEGRIEGCHAWTLAPGSDQRGDLFELLTTRDGPIEPIVHVYQVWAEPDSIRAWVCHAWQTDRLCFTGGSFRIVLCDLRPDSPTAGQLVSLLVGEEAPTFVQIAPYVAHGVQNMGRHRSQFVNMPTKAYRRERPDKQRLPLDSPLIPFRL